MKRFSCILVTLAILICMMFPTVNAVAKEHSHECMAHAAISAEAEAHSHVPGRWRVLSTWYESGSPGKCYHCCELLYTVYIECLEELSYYRGNTTLP